MGYGIVCYFQDDTTEQYKAPVAVPASDGSLPDDQLFHAAGPSADGSATPPQETTFEVHRQVIF
jgi:hypothetical protein